MDRPRVIPKVRQLVRRQIDQRGATDVEGELVFPVVATVRDRARRLTESFGVGRVFKVLLVFAAGFVTGWAPTIIARLGGMAALISHWFLRRLLTGNGENGMATR